MVDSASSPVKFERLFSYGTLQHPEVQQATFGRLLAGQADELPGYTLGVFIVRDAEFVEKSGKAAHATALPTADFGDSIAGTVLELTAEELALADRYEPAGYVRQSVRLKSGIDAWIYTTVTGS